MSSIDDPSRALIGTGFPFGDGDPLDLYLRHFAAVAPHTAGMRRPGSAALDLVHVACGHFDAFWELTLAPWDFAAGMLLVREAGGVVTTVVGDATCRSRYSSLLAGNPAMHRWLATYSGGRHSGGPSLTLTTRAMTLVECVPNFSEGRRPEIIQQIRDAIAAVSGVVVLDVSSDESHNRTVITFVAPVERAVDAAFAGIAMARDNIDLTTHSGAHPRMGATDVVPFIPLEGTTMEQCVALARTLGERVGKELGIPVFLYERAATSPVRENLADIRRGEFEKIREEIGTVARAHAGLRAAQVASDRGHGRDRRAPVSRRVQRLPRRRVEHRRRERGREGGARLLGRPQEREGDGARGRRAGAGVDESRRHREDADVPRVRHGEDGSGRARRVADVE